MSVVALDFANWVMGDIDDFFLVNCHAKPYFFFDKKSFVVQFCGFVLLENWCESPSNT